MMCFDQGTKRFLVETQKFVQCDRCNGLGLVRDTSSTSYTYFDLEEAIAAYRLACASKPRETEISLKQSVTPLAHNVAYNTSSRGGRANE